MLKSRAHETELFLFALQIDLKIFIRDQHPSLDRNRFIGPNPLHGREMFHSAAESVLETFDLAELGFITRYRDPTERGGCRKGQFDWRVRDAPYCPLIYPRAQQADLRRRQRLSFAGRR